MTAATWAIAAEGLGVPTAMIAKRAGIANGSLFNYFPTKADLLNQLYLDLKAEMAHAALDALPTSEGVREQMLHMWSHWVDWATCCPEKRRTLAHLDVSTDITPASRKAAGEMMAGIAHVLERSRRTGPLREAPLALVVALLSALADATIDFMIAHPADADAHRQAAFEAVWRMLA